MAVTTQETSDGIREKAMRIAGIDELEAGSSTARWSSHGGAENDRIGKAKELARTLCGFDNKRWRQKRRLWQYVKTVERHEFEATYTKLEHEMCRHCEESRVSDKSVHQQ